MSRFCAKKEMPCHQQGKQSGRPEFTVVALVPVVAVALPDGCINGVSVTAAEQQKPPTITLLQVYSIILSHLVRGIPE